MILWISRASVLQSFAIMVNKLSGPHRRASFVFHWGRNARHEGKAIIEKAKQEGRRALFEHEGKALLGMHGAPVSGDRLAKTAG